MFVIQIFFLHSYFFLILGCNATHSIRLFKSHWIQVILKGMVGKNVVGSIPRWAGGIGKRVSFLLFPLRCALAHDSAVWWLECCTRKGESQIQILTWPWSSLGDLGHLLTLSLTYLAWLLWGCNGGKGKGMLIWAPWRKADNPYNKRSPACLVLWSNNNNA